MKTDKSNNFFTKCPTRSEFFFRFKTGLRARMGREVKGDLALDYKIIHKILAHLEDEMFDNESTLERRRWIAAFGTFLTIGFTLALRGNEVLMLDLGELRNNLNNGKDDEAGHTVVPLLGLFKGEDHVRHHVLLAPNEPYSGFQPRKWLEWLAAAKAAEGIFKGPAFSNNEGFVLYQQPLNEELQDQLELCKENHPSLFSTDLDFSRVKCSRSLRKGSTSRAQDLGLSQTVNDANNRWRAFDRAKGSTSHLSLRDHYSTIRLMSNKMLQYPKSM